MKSVLILVGASGVGKTTLAMKLLSIEPSFYYSRSATTREVRNDSHTSEYIYLNESLFREEILKGKMLEYTEYNGSLYGTPASEIEKAFSENKTPLLVLDIEGVKTLREKSLDFGIFAVYLYEDIGVIENRLIERGDSSDIILKRKSANLRDYRALPEISGLFDAFVKNDFVDFAAQSVLLKFQSFLKGDGGEKEDNLKIARILAESANKKT